jgi:hypothetical protein
MNNRRQIAGIDVVVEKITPEKERKYGERYI